MKQNFIREVCLTQKNNKFNRLPVIHHQVVEIFLVKKTQYENCKILELGTKFCKVMSLTILDTLSHNFEPFGNSTLFVLSESHCAIHYWPENCYLHIDLVTCQKKKVDLGKLELGIKTIFNVEMVNIFNIKY